MTTFDAQGRAHTDRCRAEYRCLHCLEREVEADTGDSGDEE